MARDIIEDLDLAVDLDTDLLVRQLLLRFARMEHNQGAIMGALEDLQAADANLATEVAAVLTDVTDLQAQIAALTEQVASGVAPADLQPVIDDINAKANSIAAALAPPAPPEDAPPAEPPA